MHSTVSNGKSLQQISVWAAELWLLKEPFCDDLERRQERSRESEDPAE